MPRILRLLRIDPIRAPGTPRRARHHVHIRSADDEEVLPITDASSTVRAHVEDVFIRLRGLSPLDLHARFLRGNYVDLVWDSCCSSVTVITPFTWKKTSNPNSKYFVPITVSYTHLTLPTKA